MTPAVPPNSNAVFKAPPDWNVEKFGPCVDLHVVKENGAVTTIFSPTTEELDTLIDGGYIMLTFVGNTVVPFSLAVCKANGE